MPEPRMNHPAMIIPDAMDALHAIGTAVNATGVSPRTLGLVHFRTSQINGCGVCLLGDYKHLKEQGEEDERLVLLSGWREAPQFTDAEKAALGLAEAVTRMADRPVPVPDEVWDEAARHYDEKELGALMLFIALVNVWNRLNVGTCQVPGAYTW